MRKKSAKDLLEEAERIRQQAIERAKAERKRERTEERLRKVLLGAFAEHCMVTDEALRVRFETGMRAFLRRPDQRELFGLDSNHGTYFTTLPARHAERIAAKNSQSPAKAERSRTEEPSVPRGATSHPHEGHRVRPLPAPGQSGRVLSDDAEKLASETISPLPKASGGSS